VLHVSLLGEQAITDDRAGSIRGLSSRVVALVAFLVLHVALVIPALDAITPLPLAAHGLCCGSDWPGWIQPGS
jgi:hypothetical protein